MPRTRGGAGAGKRTLALARLPDTRTAGAVPPTDALRPLAAPPPGPEAARPSGLVVAPSPRSAQEPRPTTTVAERRSS